jgi:hypothetical protein
MEERISRIAGANKKYPAPNKVTFTIPGIQSKISRHGRGWKR